MLKAVFISFIIIVVNDSIYSQSNSYFPMAVGNEYQFQGQYNSWFCKIERDTIYSNGKRYFSFPTPFTFGDSRIDTNGNLLSGSKPFFGGDESDPEEYLLFKEDAYWGEVWPVAWNLGPVIDTGYARCIFDDTVFIFDKRRRVKGVLIFNSSYPFYFFWLAEGIGLIKDQYDDGSTMFLNYAKIEGAVYGTLVTIGQDTTIFPSELSISQNFPNPFNSITNIEVKSPLNLPKKTYKLYIYDTLGSKVYENEYSVENTSIKIDTNELNLSSGTYFYTIIYSDKQQTKKFTLLK